MSCISSQYRKFNFIKEIQAIGSTKKRKKNRIKNFITGKITLFIMIKKI
jgi:hypothetical protein